MNTLIRRPDSTGSSFLEVLIATSILGVAVIGISAVGLVATSQTRHSQVDNAVQSSVQYQMEKVAALGYDNLVAGSDTVGGYPMAWSIVGTSPKKIILTIENENWSGTAVTDTFVTYVADWK